MAETAEEAVNENPERSLDEAMTESIRSTLAEIQSRPADGEPSETAPAEETTATDRARAEDGKFVKAPKEAAKAAPATSAAPAKADTPSSPQTAAAPEQGAADAPEVLRFGTVSVDLNRPPSSWKPAAKAEWAKLPQAVREDIYRRETDFSNTVLNGPLKESADFGKAIKGVVEPYRLLIEAEGGTPEKAIADTMRTAALFRVGSPQQKLDAIFAIDKQFGAGLGGYIQNEFNRLYAEKTGQPAPANTQQPQVFRDERVDQLMQSMQAQERERSAQAERVSNAAVDQFIQAKGADGQAAYPFIDNVLEDFSARVSMIRRQNPAMEYAEVLKQAYDAAVWANPETRAVVMGQQQAQAAQPAEQLRRVEQAKRASAGNLPKRGTLPAVASTAPLRLGTPESDESIRETYRQLTAQ